MQLNSHAMFPVNEENKRKRKNCLAKLDNAPVTRKKTDTKDNLLV
jgi:hypothetical protein